MGAVHVDWECYAAFVRKAWTERACEGMLGQKAVVHSARLYHDDYAVAVVKSDLKEEGCVVGWVLTHPDPEVFKQKLRDYDRTEGWLLQENGDGGMSVRGASS